MLTSILRSRRLRALLTLTTLLLAISSYAALASSTKTVKVLTASFSVKKLTIKKGTKISWVWSSPLNHNVTVKSGPAKFHSRTQVTGAYSHRFTRKGTYHLYCTLHPYMKTTIVVR